MWGHLHAAGRDGACPAAGACAKRHTGSGNLQRGAGPQYWAGRDIYQDIDSQFSRSPALQHRQPENSFTPVHTVSIRAGSLLHRILKKEKIMVNSLHHQAVRRPGRGIKICGRALDGVAEALELPGKRFFLGVQWHPEIMWERQEDAAAVFKAFVHACAARSQ